MNPLSIRLNSAGVFLELLFLEKKIFDIVVKSHFLYDYISYQNL